MTSKPEDLPVLLMLLRLELIHAQPSALTDADEETLRHLYYSLQWIGHTVYRKVYCRMAAIPRLWCIVSP